MIDTIIQLNLMFNLSKKNMQFRKEAIFLLTSYELEITLNNLGKNK